MPRRYPSLRLGRRRLGYDNKQIQRQEQEKEQTQIQGQGKRENRYDSKPNWYDDDVTNTNNPIDDDDEDDEFNPSLNDRRYRREVYQNQGQNHEYRYGYDHEYIDDNNQGLSRDHELQNNNNSNYYYDGGDLGHGSRGFYDNEDNYNEGENEDEDGDDRNWEIRRTMGHQEPLKWGRHPRKRAALFGGGVGGVGDDYSDDGDDEKARILLDGNSDGDGGFPTGNMPTTVRGGRIVSGPFLEEGQNPEMHVRHRVVSGPTMMMNLGLSKKEGENWEYGNGDGGSDTGSGNTTRNGGGGSKRPFWTKKKKWWFVGLVILIIVSAIVIPVAVILSKRHQDQQRPSGKSRSKSSPYNSALDGLDPKSIPDSAKGTVLDPWTWYDTTDFNLTYTNETVGGLSVMGLNSTWDDSTRPNEHVPPLNESFPYGSQPIRGVNLGGWLSIEPFIVPSLFEKYSPSQGIVDEWTLCKKLGKSAATTIEKHYASFIREKDYEEIRDAGLDHVRIQYSYWAIKTYDDDPYVAKIAWRYLLRAIEYCRKYGLRVKLDLHGLPGSQNGWNHSGHQGKINWLSGTDGALNRRRSLELHDQLSKFFAQDRYKNIVTIYGLVNEPLMLSLPAEPVLNWTTEAAQLVQRNGISAFIVFHDGFLQLSKWYSMLKGPDQPKNLMLDTHQYTIFNTGEIVVNHTKKIELICDSWYPMIQQTNMTKTGWGPTMCGEWSQADTDCAKFVNDVNKGTRWEGTFDSSSNKAYCPTDNDPDSPSCSCKNANADPKTYSDDYKKWLRTYAEAQMDVFETAQGWFYWTWRTESAAQWSYRTAWLNGFMPAKAYNRDFRCGEGIPGFGGLPEYY